MTLSSTEAEYVGISELCKEILFVKQVLEFLEIRYEFPIIVHVDNVGAIYLSKNSESRRTKHIDIRYHFVREYVEQDIVKIVFVRSEDNVADVYTKNTNEQTYLKHNDKYVIERE